MNSYSVNFENFAQFLLVEIKHYLEIYLERGVFSSPSEKSNSQKLVPNCLLSGML